ncbi:histidinol dehydrogenase [Elusimicrobiota bacterium]
MDGVNSLNSHINRIAHEVNENGDSALIKYTSKYDAIELNLESLEVSKEEWNREAAKVDSELWNILQKAADNIENYAREQKNNLSIESEINNNGIKIKDRLILIEKVGVYVPGGEHPYPSTVLMCAIPAKAAGVNDVVMVTPPGNLKPSVLAAAKIAKVDRIFRVGGAHAIAALACGTESIPRVDMVVGPGNKYVQEAKRYFFGGQLVDVMSNTTLNIGIDMVAGPSEVVIIADEAQDPEWIAADLLAQAEHADDAYATLLTTSEKLSKQVSELIPEELQKRISIEGDIYNDLEETVAQSNIIAPEHLQLMLTEENLKKVENKIRNAGAVFVGRLTPVAVGDYWAGPSHTLPTGSSAKYSEGLNVRTFYKNVSFIKCDSEIVARDYADIAKFADTEGMKYHAESIRQRLEKDE